MSGGRCASPEPAVSVIIPAYRAAAHLPGAIASVAQAGLPAEAVEIVIASDDGTDYAPRVPSHPNLRFCPPGPVASGPGAARNRALSRARAAVVAFLDADDTWEPGYLSAAVPLVRAEGLAFGATAVVQAGREILRLPGGDRLTLDDVGANGASYHPVLPRALAGPFASAPAQDVMHAVEALARAGGSAPVSPRAYQLNLRPESVTRAADFSERLDAAYAAYAAQIRAGSSRVPKPLRDRAAGVFEAKAALNAAFQAQAGRCSFYEFVAATRAGDTAQSR